MRRELLAAMRKNVTRLFRSRLSLFAILFGPLLLTVIVGMAFSSAKLQGINVGVWVPEHNEAIDGIISSLGKSKQTFTIKEHSTNESCVESVRDGTSHICAAFVKKNDASVNVLFYVDYSQMSLVYMMLSAMNTQISKEATEIGTEVTQQLLDQVGAVSEYMEANDALLQNLTDGSARMVEDLRAMRTSISALDISSPVDMKGISNISSQAEAQKAALRQQQSTVSSQVGQARSELVRAREDLQSTQELIEKDRAKLAKSLTQLRTMQSSMGCSGAQTVDLTPYLEDDAALQAQLAKLARPECSIILTMQRNMEDVQRQLDVVEQRAGEGEAQLAKSEADLAAFETEYLRGTQVTVTQIDSASAQLSALGQQVQSGQARISDLKAKQQELAGQLGRAEESLAASNAALSEARTSMTVVKAQLANASSITPDAIVKPFTTKVQSLSTEKEQFDFLFPTLVILIVMFVSILAASMIVIKEKSSHAYFRNLIVPGSLPLLFSSILLTSILLGLIQVGVIFAIAGIFFHTQFLGVAISVTIVVLLGLLLFGLLGMLYGFLFSSEETTTLVSVVSAVLMFIFSSALSPIESMNPFIGKFAQINPFYLLDTMLRRIIIFDDGLGFSWQLVLLLVELALIFGLTVYVIMRARKNY